MNAFQNKCLCAFRDMKIKQGKAATIIVRNNTLCVLVGDDELYTLAVIMDPINRLLYSPKALQSV